jgi:DNA-directed RNA polymerase specialized sigma24 family protein
MPVPDNDARVRERLTDGGDAIRWTEAAVLAALRDWTQRYGEVRTAADWDRWAASEHGGRAKRMRLAGHPSPVPSPTTVVARFGSWKAAIVAAGLPPRSETRGLDASELRQTVTLYEGGLSTVHVAGRLGVAPKTVRDRLHGIGVPLRPQRRRSSRPPSTEEAAVLAAARHGASQRQLAERFGLSTRQVRAALARNDIVGGPLVRQLRTQLPQLRALELSERESGVIELVVIQRHTHRQAAHRLGIATSTIAKDLKRVAVRLERVRA